MNYRSVVTCRSVSAYMEQLQADTATSVTNQGRCYGLRKLNDRMRISELVKTLEVSLSSQAEVSFCTF